MTQSGATPVATHPKRARALELMLEGRTDREIAKELGCEPSTVWRWRHDPAFTRELHDAQRERLAVLNDRMAALVPRALDVIAGLMSDDGQPALLRLRAAESILDRAAWSGGAQERRVRAEVQGEVNAFLNLLAQRLPPDTLDAIVALVREPWPEPPPKTTPRPRFVVTAENDADEPS